MPPDWDGRMEQPGQLESGLCWGQGCPRVRAMLHQPFRAVSTGSQFSPEQSQVGSSCSGHRARVLPGFWGASREPIERTRERSGRVGRRDLGIEKMRERQAAGPQGVRDAGCRMLRTGPESAVQSGPALEHYSIGEAAHWLVALRRWRLPSPSPCLCQLGGALPPPPRSACLEPGPPPL